MNELIGPIWLLVSIVSIILSTIDFALRHKRETVFALSVTASIVALGLAVILLFIENWMPLGLTLVFCGIPAFLQGRYRQKKKDQHTRELIKQGKMVQFSPNRSFGFLKIDDSNKRFMLESSTKSHTVFRFDELLSAQLVEVPGNGRSKGPHRITRAVAGGVIAGPAGAVVGSLTGKTTHFSTISAMYISVDTKQGNVRVNFAMSDTKTDSIIYKALREGADKTMSGLNILLSETSGTTQKESLPDEIAKYKRLLDSGAITQDEFDKKKKQLLEL
ncbi:SHOCT domain-containing protein [Lacticaseibacillus baoqingensis]|uniref:SHOCT domain-containing protein n=1 Tax=Lacticaseibacillus baoqingensis TaxID=2486013 RepID=A0ABW4E8J6_9LACO|nr:SHOCT domain-containing protein [Lacticaseibacillus baoqingensis]